MNRQIIHVDMDEFFAAVEKLDNPALRGKPLLIGGDAASRGVVSTASYEARPFGCHSAMPMSRAVRLCPQAIVLPVRFERYRQLSDEVFTILEHFTPAIEPLSIDEAFLDVTGCRRLLGDGEEIARAIKAAIRKETGLTASVGLAHNKFLAKIGSDLHKPDGLTVITPDNVHQTLDGLPIERLWGVGPAGARQFHRANIRTIGQLRLAEKELLDRVLGSWAEHFQNLAKGLDDREVTSDGQAKSIGQEETFAHDIADIGLLEAVLLGHVEHVGRRMRRNALQARTISLKLRYGDFTTLSRSVTLAEPTNLTQELWQQSRQLLAQWSAKQHGPLRLLGMTASQLQPEGAGQRSLFEDPARLKQQRLDKAVDDIHSRFGSIIRRGLSHEREQE